MEQFDTKEITENFWKYMSDNYLIFEYMKIKDIHVIENINLLEELENFCVHLIYKYLEDNNIKFDINILKFITETLQLMFEDYYINHKNNEQNTKS